MQIEEHGNNDSETLERAWDDLQHTPSYVERFQADPRLLEVEAQQRTWAFCLLCGFWVEDTHQCPQEVCA